MINQDKLLKMTDLNLNGKKVFIRADLNVSLDNNQNITDDTRIQASLPTLKHAISEGAKIILASHLGRPKGKVKPEFSLKPVAERLAVLLECPIILSEDCVGYANKKILSDLKEGEILLLENLRFHKGETENETQFAKTLASYADIYINDAFGAAHRAHASTVGMVEFVPEKAMGLLMEKEITFMSRLVGKPEKPFTAIIGGAKVSDKIMVIENLLNFVDQLIIGGGMAYTFLKAQGINIGNSLLEEDKISVAEKVLKRAEIKGIKILLPEDSLVAEKFEEGTPYKVLENNEDWKDGMGLDIGPKSIQTFSEALKDSKTIFWNGPMGVFEMSPFDQGTLAIAKTISEGNALSVVGGGDSLAAVKKTGLSDKFSHLSTGGGASLEFLEGKDLPGLKALL